MLKYLLFVLSIFAAEVAYARSDLFVGNAGELVETGDGTYLFDLYSINEHLKPYVGASVDTSLPSLPEAALAGIPVDFKLLARKITDANSLAPGFGDYLLIAIKSYTWRLTDELTQPLSQTGGSRVRVASRNGGTITLSEPLFKKLSAEHRVALITHEAISSLLVPFQVRDSRSAEQLQRDVLEINGWLFSEKIYRQNPTLYQDLILSRLAVPAKASLEKLRVAPSLFVLFYDERGGEKRFNVPPRSGTDFEYAGKVREWAQQLCLVAVPEGGGPKGARRIDLKFSSNGLTVALKSYPVEVEGAFYAQNYVSIEPMPVFEDLFETKKGYYACIDFFQGPISAYLQALLWR